MVRTEHVVLSRLSARTAIKRAVRALKSGGLVIFPTETVYGLAADPAKKKALRRIYALKGRQASKNLALQVATLTKARSLVSKSILFERCARAFWPGPVTLVANSKSSAKKIGIRIPKHKVAIGILRAFKRPLAVTSANLSGQKDLLNAKDLIRCFGGKVEMIMTGPVRRSRASTVIDVTGGEPVVLRKGPIKIKEIRRVGIS